MIVPFGVEATLADRIRLPRLAEYHDAARRGSGE